MKMIKYIGVLVKNIYSSSFEMLCLTVKTKGDFETEIVTCKLRSTSNFHQMLICIGITLTPGTLVSKKEGALIDVLKVKNGDTMPHQVFDEVFAPTAEGGAAA